MTKTGIEDIVQMLEFDRDKQSGWSMRDVNQMAQGWLRMYEMQGDLGVSIDEVRGIMRSVAITLTGYEHVVNDAIAALEQHRWRRVEDELPEPNIEVLTASGYVAMRKHNGKEWLDFGPDCVWRKSISLCLITHWMPLPPPPQETDE